MYFFIGGELSLECNQRAQEVTTMEKNKLMIWLKCVF